ncbi:MAG: hypothetical protein JEZ07_20225 [Phycisphaerae bacterium]|nr:hypothetical protein [Phycisphaerae bacterium]
MEWVGVVTQGVALGYDVLALWADKLICAWVYSVIAIGAGDLPATKALDFVLQIGMEVGIMKADGCLIR